MGKYTDFFEDKSFSISDEDDLYEELEKVMDSFRTFDKVLDTFLVTHGFSGNVENIEEKVEFIKSNLKAEGITSVRDIKKWYTDHKNIERKTAFLLCFALKLNQQEADDFLKRVCLTRGFDFHLAEEVVYFYAFKNGLSYKETADILAQVKKPEIINMPKDDVIYTDMLAEEIDEIESAKELVAYLNENIEKYMYNNATAYRIIEEYWKCISDIDGLAMREKQQLYKAFNKGDIVFTDTEIKDKEIKDKEIKDIKLKYSDEGHEKQRKVRKRDDDSIWEIYLQIIGLAGNMSDDFYKGRSIKFILEDNNLIHPLAENCFPDRNGLTYILAGKHVSHERVRKILILLAFYKFWVSKALENKSYGAGYENDSRCICEINAVLEEAGYAELYYGNPYDFIFYVSIYSEYPLYSFREYMQEMFYRRMDEIENGENYS